MTASTCVLVETGDEDPLVSVATLVDGLVGDASGKIAKECAALLEAGKFVDAVGKIMAHGAKLLADASEKDLEASVLIVGGLAQRLPAADAASLFSPARLPGGTIEFCTPRACRPWRCS